MKGSFKLSDENHFRKQKGRFFMNAEQEMEVFSAYTEWIDNGDCREIMQFGRELLCREIPRICSAALLSGNIDSAISLVTGLGSRKDELTDENWAVLCDTRERLRAIAEKGGWLPVSVRSSANKISTAFPKGAFPPEIESYLESISTSVQVPREMPFAAALAAFALCLQGKYKAEYPDFTEHTEHLCLYVGIVADPSERKSPVYKAVINRPFYKWAEEAMERYKADLAEYKANRALTQKQIDILEKGIKGDVPAEKRDELASLYHQLDSLKMPANPCFLFDDTTPEALVRGLVTTEGIGGIFSEEGDVLDIIAGRYSDKGNANIGIFLKAYNGERFRSTRVTSGEVQLERPLLSVCLMLQPELYGRIISDKTLQGRGCIARFLFTRPEKAAGSRQSINMSSADSKGCKAYDNLLCTFLDTAPVSDSDMRVLRFCDEIKGNRESPVAKYLQMIENSMREGGVMAAESAYTGKAGGTFIRIAGILHLVWGYDERTPISADTAERAMAVHKYFLSEKRREMQDSSDELRKQADKIMERLLRRVQGRMNAVISKRDFYNDFRRTCGLHSIRDFNAVLEFLESENKIEVVQKGKKVLIYISPYMFRQFRQNRKDAGKP